MIKNKREKNKEKFDDSNLYRDDLRARVEKLEDEKTNLMNRLTNLSSELSAIKVKLEFIEKENDRLLRR